MGRGARSRLASLVLLWTCAPAAAFEKLAFTGATVLDGRGAVLENATVLVDGEKVAQVGRAVAVPAGFRTIDLRGRYVIPGLVDAHTHAGLFNPPIIPETFEATETADPISPEMDVRDAIQLEGPLFASALRSGVTTVLVLPASSDLIGGMGIALKTSGEDLRSRVLPGTEVMKLALGLNPKSAFGSKNRAPKTRMGIAALLHEAFERARRYAAEGKGGGDAKVESLARVVRGEIPVHIHCAQADEILFALDLMKQYRLRGSLGHVYEGLWTIGALRSAGVPVVIGPLLSGWEEGRPGPRPLDVAGGLARAGVKVALMSDNIASGDLRLQAAMAVRLGMSPDDALRAITSVAAEIIGAAARVGTLEAGKDADLVVLTGPPLDVRSSIEAVWLQGRQVYSDPKEQRR